MNAKKTAVLSEAISIQVGEFLLSKGFNLARCSGIEEKNLTKSEELSILYKDPEIGPRKYFFGLIKIKPRRVFLGSLWFSNLFREADEAHWIFDLNGRKYMPLVRQLADEMVSRFNVEIHVNLVNEQPEFECFKSDFSD